MHSPLQMPKKGPVAIGKKDLDAHLAGQKLTYRQQVLAKCYECMCGYIDGKRDCKIESCPLYKSMPYRGKAEDV